MLIIGLLLARKKDHVIEMWNSWDFYHENKIHRKGVNMCKYMILKNGIPMCKNGQMCTLCVIGNSKTYKELESNEENNNEKLLNKKGAELKTN